MSKQQRKSSSTYTRNSRAYVEGNTVRRLDTLPEYQPQRERREKPRQKPKNVLVMSPWYVLFLVGSVMITLGVFVMYIQLQTDINKRMSEITAVEEKILDLKTKNDALLTLVETSVNMEEVKDIAINQMGMVYPEQEQVKSFSIDVDDYMNQYRDIPKK